MNVHSTTEPEVYPPETVLFASAHASAHFALACLEPYRGHLRAKSSFVTPTGEIMHWHDFGDLEGPGWAANSVGGAHLLFRWGRYLGDRTIQTRALSLLDHVLEDGFIVEDSGFIWPYYELAQDRFCLNYVHQDDWLCPGSLARIGVQLLEFADDLQDDPPAAKMREAARRLGAWLQAHVPRLSNGWVPRRIRPDGQPHPFTPDGRPDPIFDHSADGLFLLQLIANLMARGLDDYREEVIALGDAFIESGGFWGSINHDTYDDHENVAYAVAFRVLHRAAAVLERPAWREFAYRSALPGLARYRMGENRNGVATQGLLWMEETWDTAYLWENAEASLAYLEGWAETGEEAYRQPGLAILEAIACHHYGDLGFLTEGVDWNNHVTRRHHIGEALYGDIRYTEPLLNNLHLIAPTLFYLEKVGYRPPAGMDDTAAISLASTLSAAARPPVAGAKGARYLLRLYHSALATDEKLVQAIAFVRTARADGVLLFESSYALDPALLTLDVLRQRFARLKEIIPRFREVVPEVHVNVMITIGHVDAGCARPERFPFQFQADEHGNVSRSSACPLDSAFQAHVAEQYRLAAGCEADVIWVDDDYRYTVHDVPGLPCFCPHHLVAMGQRTGREWSREDLVAALRDDATDPAIRHAWFNLQEESMLHLARVIEQAIHRVSPATRIGLMSIGTAQHAMEGRHTDRLLRTLAGQTRPLIRPGSGYYTDWTPAAVVDKSEDCARQMSFVGADVQGVAEVENFPYTPFGKSERVLALELALDVLANLPDLSLNLLSGMNGREPLEPEGTDYAAFLSRWRPFLDALARERAGKVQRGVGIADSEDCACHAPLRGQSLTAWLVPRPWEPLLARIGLPIGRPDGAPHWLAGEVVRALSEGELVHYLREGAVLDPVAAQALLERGWGERLGLKEVRPLDDAVNEFLTDDPLNGLRAGHGLPTAIPSGQVYTFEVDKERSRVLSRWINVDGEDLGIAAVALSEAAAGRERSASARLGILPYAVRSVSHVLLNMAHREQWAALLAWAAYRDLPCRISTGVNLYPLAFTDPEKGGWLFAVANLSADDVAGSMLEVTALSDGVWRVDRLDGAGGWQPVADFDGRNLYVDMGAFSLAAFRCRRVS